ncbi:hypothetical protein FALCPG4_003085 [Fusarium falciforme]
MRGFASGNAQLIVTGRPEPDFNREIPSLFDERNCVLLDKRAVNADIRSYDLLEKIRDKVGDRADGMFRWAACQLDSLTECLSPNAIELALESLPRDLNKTYYRMLQNIPSTYKSGAIRLLQFLVYAKRPLKLSEAIEVIATQIDREPRRFYVGNRLFSGADVLRYCPSLVLIADVTRYGETVQELHLAYFSVKEYLLKEDQFDMGNINAQGSHFSNALQAASSGGHLEVVQLLLDKGADVNAQGGHFSNALQAASSGSHLEVVQLLLDKGADVNAQGGQFGNALQASSSGSRLEVVQLLLDKGADVNAQGGPLGNALQAALFGGHLEVVQLLLDKGADVNAQGGQFGNALQAASERGHLEVVQLLLDKGADVNTQGGLYGNALQAASDGGHLEIVQLLLDEGADINAQGG